MLSSRLRFPLRAGVFRDRQLFRAADDSVPAFGGWSVGAGIVAGRLLLDVAYVYESGSFAERLDPDTFETLETAELRSHRVFFSIIYRHTRN